MEFEFEQTNDPVRRPGHYTGGKVECIEAIEAAFGERDLMGFCEGNAMKYLWRHDKKGHPVEDLQKAKWYIDRLIAIYEPRESGEQEI